MTLREQYESPSAVIAYDSRRFSPEFALEAALVLAGNGVKAYVLNLFVLPLNCPSLFGI